MKDFVANMLAMPTCRVRPRHAEPTHLRFVLLVLGLLICVRPVFGQAVSPWETAVDALQTSFTGPIAKGLSLVAVVVGGMMFAYSEGAAKRTFAGLLFGCGAALSANNFINWLFP